MKANLYSKINFIVDTISLNNYQFLTQQKLILPFYHSVTNNPKPHLKGIGYFRSQENFLKDLTFLTQNFDSIPIENLSSKIKKSSFHITFDDGLSEIYENVLPILITQKIHATFFINSDFVENKILFYRHKIGVILNQIKNSTSDLEKIASFLKVESNQVYAKINLISKNETFLIDEIANKLSINFDDYLNENKPYLTEKQLIEIKKMGFTIGNHSKSHSNFKDLNFENQKQELSLTNEFLKNKIGVQDLYFSFPFGDENIKNDFFEFMYNQENIINSFGISGLKNDEFKKHLHRIPMEENGFSAEQIIKFEYFYYILKTFIGKNKIKR